MENLIVFFCLGLILCVCLMFLYFKLKNTKNDMLLETEKVKFETIQDQNQREISRLENENVDLNKKVKNVEFENSTLNAQLSALQTKVENAEKRVEEIKLEQQKVILKKDEEEKKHLETQQRLSAIFAENKFLSEKLETQKSEMTEMVKRFNLEFENIANRIFDQKTQDFKNLNSEHLKNILQPFGDDITAFKNQVNKIYVEDVKDRVSLKDQIKSLMEQSIRLSDEANSLTKALKADTSQQGYWGEQILETILENSGLRKNEMYFVQETLRDENGKIIQNAETNQTMRPDVIVRYPDQRAIIIDSKVSLTAYLDFINATTTEEKDDAIKRHLKSIKNHIDELATRNYAQYLSSSPDFVMMFIPNEPAYYLVQEKNPSIWEYAYKKKVVMITPTNLITALRMFSEIWQRDEQFKNVEQIIDRANKMYDKIVNYLETFEKLGKSIKSAAKDYDVAMGQLKEGPGNVVRQIQELEKLGVKSLHSKIIPSSLRSQGDELLE